MSLTFLIHGEQLIQILGDILGMLGENHPVLTIYSSHQNLLNDINERKINPCLHSDHIIL